MNKYIAEIAGKDSIAAVLRFASQYKDIEIVPTIVVTGTEYGDMSSYEKSIEFLRSRLKESCIRLTDAIYIQDGALWNYINARYQYSIYKKFLFYTPCITCHLYTHLLRFPICRKYEAKGLITGERKSHSGKFKANQHKRTIEIFDWIFENSGIEFIRPLLGTDDTGEVDSLIGDEEIIRHANDVKCVMSGNLKGFSLEVENHLLLMEKYLKEYVYPVGKFCIECMEYRGKIDMKGLDLLLREILNA